jgi:Carboxypeptidase regulatory-like domain
MRSISRCAWFAVVMLLVIPAVSSAQFRGLGQIRGTVKDDTGAPLKGVNIRATLPAQDGAIEITSDDKGGWVVAGMGKGEWHVTFQTPGYNVVAAKVTLAAELERIPPITVVLKKIARSS